MPAPGWLRSPRALSRLQPDQAVNALNCCLSCAEGFVRTRHAHTTPVSSHGNRDVRIHSQKQAGRTGHPGAAHHSFRVLWHGCVFQRLRPGQRCRHGRWQQHQHLRVRRCVAQPAGPSARERRGADQPRTARLSRASQGGPGQPHQPACACVVRARQPAGGDARPASGHDRGRARIPGGGALLAAALRDHAARAGDDARELRSAPGAGRAHPAGRGRGGRCGFCAGGLGAPACRPST